MAKSQNVFKSQCHTAVPGYTFTSNCLLPEQKYYSKVHLYTYRKGLHTVSSTFSPLGRRMLKGYLRARETVSGKEDTLLSSRLRV